MINYIFKAVTFTTALLSLYNEVRRTGIFERGKEYEKCKPVRGFTAREFLGNFLCLVNQQLTRAACSKDTNEKQNVPKSFLCCFLGTKVQIFRETTKSS